jgi:hypothetical protein
MGRAGLGRNRRIVVTGPAAGAAITLVMRGPIEE